MNLLIDIIHDWHEKHNFCNRISASCTIWTSITEWTAANLELKDDGSSPWPTHEIRRFHPKDSSERFIRKHGTRRPNAQALPINRTRNPEAQDSISSCFIPEASCPDPNRQGERRPDLSTKGQDRRQERSKAQAPVVGSDQARRRQGKTLIFRSHHWNGKKPFPHRGGFYEILSQESSHPVRHPDGLWLHNAGARVR